MSRLGFWLVLLPSLLVVIWFSANNYGIVDISLWPFTDREISIPMHVVAVCGLLLGFLLGGILAWFQGGNTRRRLRRLADQAQADQRELEALRSEVAQRTLPPPSESDTASAKGLA